MLLGFRHVGIVVDNLEKVSNFYLALGFKISSKANEKDKFIEKITGIENTDIEWIKMSLNDGSLLELIKYIHPKSDLKLINQPSNRFGVSHIAFNVKDIDTFSKKVINLGGSIVNPPELTNNGLYKVAYCHDNEGNLFEIVEAQ